MHRNDTVKFDGPVLDSPLAMTGKITASIAFGSTANDTDFIVRLVDVSPGGVHGLPATRMLITDGVVRMRWRNGAQRPLSMERGSQYQTELDMWSTSFIVATGHRIGLEITSSSVPAYSPNPNNGLPLSAVGPNVTAANSIFVGSSYITLPIVSIDDLPHWEPPF